MRISNLARKEVLVAFCFLAPSLIGFALFYLIPFGQSIAFSFENPSGEAGFSLANYQSLLASSSFQKAMGNTFWFTIIGVPILILLSLSLAMLLNKRVFFQNWLRTSYVLPLVVPVASIVLVWQILFDWNGFFNYVLEWLGIDRIDWMKSDWAQGVVIVIYVWKNIGYNVILFLAGLQNIPDQYYEIANLEGASWARKLQITLIYLIPTGFLVILMSILNSFKVFREIYLVAGDYPHDSIYMLQHYMNNMFLSLDIQKLSAAACLMVLCILVIVLILFRVERKFRSFME
ncbi:sugar ABC transporter permease [Paenibacillus baekrokdamisoli]|uniref:Sugar ABC transporter permease n=1 Tax=Paenibacillus baekrokdamisoli TaxID=1712516 RepID=A0A3G9JF54_9BACL|nr:sugar ABC transporter permease [Paenibacillus baekrokdamisoli]MBB3068771.1 multiple sugar transport system permease protein [Paenibacillus baekrokdamisoli]BBH23603.1 sugar ABC transporter permease [Paenibacillus baekrokdamisoli]